LDDVKNRLNMRSNAINYLTAIERCIMLPTDMLFVRQLEDILNIPSGQFAELVKAENKERKARGA